MALSRVKTWISGEVLTASDLNAEYNNILTNPTSLISPLTGAISLNGQTITLDAAAATNFVSSAAVSWNFTSGAKTGTPATTGSIANWSAQTFTDSATAGSGTATAFVAHAIQRPTLAATNASVVTTDAASLYISNAPAAGTNETLTNAYALWIDDGRVRLDPSASVVSAAGATLDAVNITAQTATISGSTNITTAAGVNYVSIKTPTYSAGTALTITNAATLYIAAAPAGAGAGPATITNAYSIWVDAGDVRFDGIINAAGGQIAFPAAQNASADANTLDDYEEGTWTPVLTFATPGNLAVSYSRQVGSYTKIGRSVRITVGIATSSFTHTTASGSCQITGLPFASSNVSNLWHHGALNWGGITKVNYTDINLRITENVSLLIMVAAGSAQTAAAITTADTPTAGTVVVDGACHYHT